MTHFDYHQMNRYCHREVKKMAAHIKYDCERDFHVPSNRPELIEGIRRLSSQIGEPIDTTRLTRRAQAIAEKTRYWRRVNERGQAWLLTWAYKQLYIEYYLRLRKHQQQLVAS